MQQDNQIRELERGAITHIATVAKLTGQVDDLEGTLKAAHAAERQVGDTGLHGVARSDTWLHVVTRSYS